MRKIEFDIKISNDRFSPVESDKMYIINLPNNAKPQFKNRKDAVKFVSDSRKLFAKTLYELNEIFSELYSDYRSIYFNIDIQEETDFENSFDQVKLYIKKSFMEAQITGNGIYYCYKNVISAFLSINNILDALDHIYRKIKLHQKTWKNDMFRERLERNKLKIKSWGYEYHQPVTRFKEMNISKFENDFFKAYPLY